MADDRLSTSDADGSAKVAGSASEQYRVGSRPARHLRLARHGRERAHRSDGTEVKLHELVTSLLAGGGCKADAV